MGLDLNIVFIKMESLILAKGLPIFYKRVRFTRVILLVGIGGLFDIEMTSANKMVALGASGAQAQELTKRHEHLFRSPNLLWLNSMVVVLLIRMWR